MNITVEERLMEERFARYRDWCTTTVSYALKGNRIAARHFNICGNLLQKVSVYIFETPFCYMGTETENDPHHMLDLPETFTSPPCIKPLLHNAVSRSTSKCEVETPKHGWP